MSKPISVALVIQMGFFPLYGLALPSSAVSTETGVISRLASEVVGAAEKSEALFGAKSKAISKLWQLANECREDNWDDYGSALIQHSTVYNAVEFIRSLPDKIELPEFSPEPDGSISMDWVRSRNRVFSISLNSQRTLAYAWLDGAERGHGVAVFDRGVITPRILHGISSVMENGPASLRIT